MNKIICRFLFTGLLFIAFFSCKKEGAQLSLNEPSAFTGPLKASSDTVLLTSSRDNDSVLVFNWQAVPYGQQAVVSYTLQMDVPSDTSGEQAWAKAKSFQAGNYVTSYGFLGKDLNNLLIAMGINPDVSSPIAFRVIANVNQYNGSASVAPAVYSNTQVVAITAYPLSFYVPGDYQGWDPSKAPFLNPVAGVAGKFEGYYNMPGSGTHYFKYTNAPDWNHTNYGDSSVDGFLSNNGLAGGLYVSDGGYIEVTADFNTLKWTATKTTWGIIGDATPGGWNTDTEMTYDPVSQTWTVVAVMKQAGSFKFRANNDWKIDFGIDGSGNLQYADNPFFTYNPNLNNLSVPADGTYTITLDLHVSGKYNYSVVKM